MVIKFYLVLAFLLKCHGGDEEIRTPDPLLARQVLSQLSYTPIKWNYYNLNPNMNNVKSSSP